ncbi:MAG: hypothetical protein GWM89_04070 [Candidatus Dadabacteria bacterium]|nr:hypothetical protein [Candidatus Dadabacteria bacterium]NIV41979.1 hypothetical protein [Candidatus Dadabacteria bacterium]NIX14695.1 hypothetical protein [Candidatus Dadabacteria bacterium]NIY21600.1 hypothetical protein [Candidatus Dadabacteria bacterium]
MSSSTVLVVLFIWFLIAFFLGFSGRVSEIPFPLPQIVLFGLVVVQMIFFGLSKGFRQWLYSVNIKYLVAVHLSRFVGIYFIILYSREMLPYDFAIIGGIGDIVVAVGALLILIFLSSINRTGSRIYILWNTAGLLDILFVVMTAGRIGMNSPEYIENLLKLPLSLLPTFLVPIIIFTHIVIYIRLFKKNN